MVKSDKVSIVYRRKVPAMSGLLKPSVTGALASLSQTTIVTLANINFNFTLWKRDAPAEYQPLREALSPKRKEAAESGHHHIIARKLGALFEPILPELPYLFKAYGVRASEIATSEAAKANLSGSYGCFTEHVGVDGTSIWAAATSGDGAIAVHLLACMLARHWSPAEAIAAWEEIVNDRKNEIRLSETKSHFHIEAVMASKIDVTTQELATWDASARSWLETADKANKVKQKQLMLILDNLDRAIEGGGTTFRNVFGAWCKAMETMDKLIEGIGHVVQSGMILLGMSSWHLYPDMTVLGRSTKEISFKDPLISRSGNLTVGLQDDLPIEKCGVYWSLPLSRLRYYGDTQTAQKSLRIDTSRVNFDQFLFAILGCASLAWTPKNARVTEAVQFFKHLDGFFETACTTTGSTWPAFLSKIASRLLSLDGIDRDYAERLFKLGRRSPSFLRYEEGTGLFDDDARDSQAQSGERPPMQVLTRLLKNNMSKLDMLWLAVNQQLGPHTESLVIRSANPGSATYYFAGGLDPLSPHVLETPWLGERGYSTEEELRTMLVKGLRRSPAGHLVELRGSSTRPWKRFMWLDPPEREYEAHPTLPLGRSIKKFNFHNPIDTVPNPAKGIVYKFIYGDEKVGLFLDTASSLSLPRQMFGIQEIQKALAMGLVDPVELLKRANLHLNSVRSIAAAAAVFESMPDATVSLEALSRITVADMKWAQSDPIDFEMKSQQSTLAALLKYDRLSRSHAFACICMFASGTVDLAPSDLNRVFAISSGDSLYVSRTLLSDPSMVSGDEISWISGNIGRAGVALLEPPKNLKVLTPANDNWKIMNFHDFDGKKENNFEGTSLLLSFTDYERSVDQVRSGDKFVQAFFIQSIVSVFNCGKWVADLDTVAAAEAMIRYDQLANTARHCNYVEEPPQIEITSIDNWDEFLHKSDNCQVVRANQNWLARLALATISIYRGDQTIVLPNDAGYCWHDVLESVARTQPEYSAAMRRATSSIVEDMQVVFIQ